MHSSLSRLLASVAVGLFVVGLLLGAMSPISLAGSPGYWKNCGRYQGAPTVGVAKAHAVACPEAKQVLHLMFVKAQSHGLPVRAGGYRCRAAPPMVICTDGRRKIKYG